VHKQLMLLGLLQRGPLHGYELHRIVRAHGELYADLKKANVYYLLDRLAHEGHVAVTTEPGARGNRGERLIYTLTAKGRAHFGALLRAVLSDFTPTHTGLDVAVVFLNQLPRPEAVGLIAARRDAIAARRDQVAAELGDVAIGSLPGRLAADHLLGIIDAELAWANRALSQLREAEWGDTRASTPPSGEDTKHGE
jgi:DNA-binding PadR family transcriptional regulator